MIIHKGASPPKLIGAKLIAITLKIALWLIIADGLSLELAYFWRDHWDGWRNYLAGDVEQYYLLLIGPFLSADVYLAEDQADFWWFLIPSMFATAAVMLALTFVWRRTRAKQ